MAKFTFRLEALLRLARANEAEQKVIVGLCANEVLAEFESEIRSESQLVFRCTISSFNRTSLARRKLKLRFYNRHLFGPGRRGRHVGSDRRCCQVDPRWPSGVALLDGK